MPKISYAASMIVEDHLKKMLSANSNKPFKPYDNKNLPKMKHSPFGDYPADFLTAKKITSDATPTAKIGGDLGIQELSVTAKGLSKFTKILIETIFQVYLRKAKEVAERQSAFLDPRISQRLRSLWLALSSTDPSL
jgi:hypothetical protein